MKKRYQIGLVVIGCLIALIGLSYAYFMATSTGGGKGGDISVETYTIDNVGFNIEGEMEFNDLDIYPGHKNISKIKVTAIGKEDIINYKLLWEGTNTINTALKYYVYKTTEDKEASITCNKREEQKGASKIYYETCEEKLENIGSIVASGEITKNIENKELALSREEVIKGTEEGNVIYYYVVLEYPNLEESQNIDMEGTFEGKVTVKKEEDSIVDLNIKKIYQETETGYEEINRMPSSGYMLNSEKSSCTNNATPVSKGNKIVITNLTSSNTECNIYFDKDKEKPVITSVTPVVAETEINVTVTASDNIGVTEYYYQIDDSEFVKGEGNTHTFTGLTPKTSHTIKAYVKDAMGNESEITTITASTIDTTKPEIINVTSSATMREITVTVEARDNVRVAEYYYSIDNGEFIKEESNSHTFTELGINTSHTISVYVKDSSGNESDISTNTFKTEQDEEKPVITNVETNATETEISVTVEGTDNVGITEYYYQLDSNEPVKQTTNTYTFTGLTASTTHTINVYTKDAAGNQSDTTTKSVTTLDTTKPTISKVTTSGTETEITVTVTANDNVGVSEYYFAIDNNTFNRVTTNTFKFTGLTAGVTHSIKVYVKDAAGNQSETTTKSVTTPDTTNPIISNITTSVTETEINVTVSATDNTEVTEYWYAIDSGSFTKGTGNTHKFTGLSAKTTHTVKAYVKDKFGNQSETLTTSATTIDSTKPTISKVTSSVTMTEITVTVTATDNVGVTEYWYKIDNGSFTKGTGNTKTFTGLGINSSHTISVYVKDASGNQSTTSSNVIVTAADTAKPTISNVTTSATETEISVTVTSTDNVGVTEYWYAINNGTFTKGTGSTHKFTGLKASTAYTIKVYTKDAAGNQSDTTTKSVTTPDTTKPTISNVTTTVTKTEINVTVTASDNVGVTEYWYQIGTNAAVKATTNTHQFTGLTAGTTYSVKVYVKDKAGNQSTTTTKTVTTKTATEETLNKLNITNIKTTTPDFTTVATTDEGVFKVEDGMYGGYSYYWRGAATTNYVKFGGFCWRIIRINGDGTIRLIYDGTTCHANGTITTDSIAKTNVTYYSAQPKQSNYVGWTYTGTSQRTLSGTNSRAKTQLESWYGTNLSSYASKIADGKYCNDRNVASGYTWAAAGKSFDYAIKNRVTTGAPSLACDTGDIYTLKVGLITADEAVYAGGTSNTNKIYYLFNGQSYWTMTPSGFNGTDRAYVRTVIYTGQISSEIVYSNYVNYTAPDLRPVINLTSDVTFASGGNGTQSNPYVVS